MPIPPQYNGDFGLWINDVFSTALQGTQEWTVFIKYWANFTAAQKTQIKNLVIATLNTHITNVQAIITEIQAV